MEIFTQEGYGFLARWAHFLAGITWIGILYYFNFVQVPAFAEMEAGARSEVLRKISFRALWWFRWGAVLTLLSGLTIIAFQENYTREYFRSATGTAIATGAVLGIIMFSNVWLVIWPAQKSRSARRRRSPPAARRTRRRRRRGGGLAGIAGQHAVLDSAAVLHGGDHAPGWGP